MNISLLAYELYKVDWMKRIPPERQMESLRKYFKGTDRKYMNTYGFEEYLFDNGYDGELYVCYDEFLYEEYLDEEYMKELLNDDELFAIYKEDRNL